MPRVNWVMGVLPSIKAKHIPDRVFYPNMIGKILVNLVQNRVMISLLGSYDFVVWVKICHRSQLVFK